MMSIHSKIKDNLLMGFRRQGPATVQQTDNLRQNQTETMTSRRTLVTSHPVLAGLSKSQLAGLRGLWHQEILEAGTVIFNEGQTSDEIYFIVKGEAEVLKWNEARTQQYQLQTLGVGQVFGDVSFLTGAPRSAAVKALTPLSVIKLSRRVLRERHPEAKRIEQVLANPIATMNITRLQAGNEEYVRNLEQQVAELKTRLEFGTFLGLTIVMFIIITLVSRYVTFIEATFSPTSFQFSLYLWLAVTVPVIYFVRRHHYQPRDFGLVLGNWRRDLLAVSRILLVLSGLLAVVMGVDAWFFQGTGLSIGLDFGRFNLGMSVIYMASVFGQELLARGFIQGCMERFLMDKQGGRTIIWSSAIFALMHINYGIMVVAVTFLAGLLFGYVYWRQRSVLGVSVLHWVLGVVAVLIGILPA